jgi:hypothetical protein
MTALGSSPETAGDLGRQVKAKTEVSDAFCDELAGLYNRALGTTLDRAGLRATLATDDGVTAFLVELLASAPLTEWAGPIESVASPATLGIHDGTLGIARQGGVDEKLALRAIATSRFAQGSRVVILGHTHQPDRLEEAGRQYFNPGSWTRYVELDKVAGLRLEDLRREEDFPFELNFVRVELAKDGSLRSELVCHERREGRPRSC